MTDELEDDQIHPLPTEPSEIARLTARIAPPSATNGYPAMNLRGLPAPAPSSAAAPGSTGDLEAEGLASHIAPRPIASPSAPSASQSKMLGDENELQRKLDTGSGVSQIQHGSKPGGIGIAKPHPILGGILRGLDIAGSAIAPAVMQNIPGTTMHHNLGVARDRGTIAQDTNEQEKEATTEETKARANLADQQAAELGQPKAKEEKWDPFTNWTDTDGTPLIHEENSGQVVRANDKKPPTGFQAAKPPTDKQDPTVKVNRVVNGVPHEVLVNGRTGEDIKDEGQTKLPGESADDKHKASEMAQVEREARGNIRKAEGQYRDAQKSVSQLNSAIDVAKDGNGLMTSFLPTMEVLGISVANGVHRISPSEAQAAAMPGSVVERFNAYFDKATTGKVTPQLQAEGKVLGKILSDSAYQRYKSIYDDESNMVAGYGGKDFGKRVPLIKGDETGGSGGGGNNQPPKGATMKVPGSDGKLHWSDGKKDLGVAE